MIKIVIADDHELMREGICRIIGLEKDFKVVGLASNGGEALDLCAKLNPDVLLLDFSMPDMDGFDVTCRLSEAAPDVKIVIVTMHDNDEYAKRLIDQGAKGFVIKGESSKELVAAIRKVAAGGIFLSPTIMERIALKRVTGLADDSSLKALTQREFQIFTRLAKGMKNIEIADELCLSASTVNTYRQRIMEKLDLKNKSELVRLAVHHKLLESD